MDNKNLDTQTMDTKKPNLHNIIITQDNKQFKKQLRKLWELVFDEDSKAYLDFYFEWVYSKNRVIVALFEGELVGMLHMNPYALDGRKIYYIVGVATHPEFRGMGVMGKMMEAGIAAAKEEGVKDVLLLPADERFYRSFGFEFVSHQYNTTIQTSHYTNMLKKVDMGGLYRAVVTKEAFIQTMMAMAVNRDNSPIKHAYEPLWTNSYLNQLYEEITCEGGHIGTIHGCVIVFYLEDVFELRNYYLRPVESEQERAEMVEAICLTLLGLAKGRPLVLHEVNEVVLASFFAYVKENNYDFRPYMMQLRLDEAGAREKIEEEVFFNEVV